MNGIVAPDIPRTRRLKIADLNPHLMCVLCGGYYIDATTIIECLHSFCKTCIVRYLETSKYCPICDVQVHKTRPLLNIRSDQTLQDIVYKLVPGLYQREMKRRREFYAKHPHDGAKVSRSNEERGEVESDYPLNIFMPDEFISIALEYSECGGFSNSPEKESSDKSQTVCRRYLRCPVFITVAQIKKLIRAKYGLSSDHKVDVLFSQDNLNDDFMLMDIAYMYAWKRKCPLKLFFRIYERPPKRLKTFHYRPPLFGFERFRNNVHGGVSGSGSSNNKKVCVTAGTSECGGASLVTSSASIATGENHSSETAPHAQPVANKQSETSAPNVTDIETKATVNTCAMIQQSAMSKRDWRSAGGKMRLSSEENNSKRIEKIVSAIKMSKQQSNMNSYATNNNNEGEGIKEEQKKTRKNEVITKLVKDKSNVGDGDQFSKPLDSAENKRKLPPSWDFLALNGRSGALFDDGSISSKATSVFSSDKVNGIAATNGLDSNNVVVVENKGVIESRMT